MKKIVFLLALLVLSSNFYSALEIETNENYSLGESFVAQVSANFYTPLTKENIYFYRENVETSFGVYNLNKINDEYYVSFSIAPEKIPGNYSIRIKDAQYFDGTKLIDDEVVKKFTILDKTTFVQISPALSFPTDYKFNVSVTNLESKKISVFYGLEGYQDKNVSLLSGETKNVEVETFGGNLVEKILFTYENETIPAYAYLNLEEVEHEDKTPVEPEVNESKEEEKQESFWDKLFGSDDEENSTLTEETSEETNDNSNIQTCSELGLSVCSSTETCDGNLVDGKEAQCCNGTCVEKKDNSSKNKTIGWLIIAGVVLFLAWFFKTKFAKARRS